MVHQILAVVLNWNSGPRDLVACVESLLEQTDVDLTVMIVDNDSMDSSFERASTAFSREPRVVLLQTGANLGYAGGNNWALRHPLVEDSSTPVLIINPDARFLDPGGLARLACSLEPGVGAVAPVLLPSVDSPQVEALQATIDFRSGSVGKAGFGSVSRRELPTEPLEADWLDGAAVLFSRAALRSTGLLDERFFLYFEEVDWCIRAKRAGFRLLMQPACQVLHPRGGSFTNSKAAYFYWRNYRLLLSKHPEFHRAARLSYWPRLAKAIVQGRLHRRGALQGMSDTLRGRYGAGRA